MPISRYAEGIPDELTALKTFQQSSRCVSGSQNIDIHPIMLAAANVPGSNTCLSKARHLCINEIFKMSFPTHRRTRKVLENLQTTLGINPHWRYT